MTAQQPHQEVPIIPSPRTGVIGLYVHTFLAAIVGLALRLLLVFEIPALTDDSRTYLQLGRNWVDHHVYGLWLNGHLVPTDLRLPGYPAFLAGLAMVFGRATRAIVLSQVGLDLCTCFLVAALCATLAPMASRRRTAIAGLWLAATCPFVASYSAIVLTEELVAFLTTVALVLFVVSLRMELDKSNPCILFIDRRITPFSAALLGSFVTGFAAQVRPEMPLLWVSAMLVYAARWWKLLNLRQIVIAAAALGGAFLLPMIPWTVRNLVTLHEFQPMAPRYATMPGEYAPVGYYVWTGTWLERYRDVYLNVWKIGEEPVDMEDLPDKAFDSAQERARVADLFGQYNKSNNLDISPEVDREFAEIARERTHRHPLRTWVIVPFQRALTIWFTPRTELLPVDGKFFPVREQWEDSRSNFLITAGFGFLGYAYAALALAGIWIAWRGRRSAIATSISESASNLWGVGLIVTYLIVRTIFLTTVEAPEPRYVVSCYPAVLALGATIWAGRGTDCRPQQK